MIAKDEATTQPLSTIDLKVKEGQHANGYSYRTPPNKESPQPSSPREECHCHHLKPSSVGNVSLKSFVTQAPHNLIFPQYISAQQKGVCTPLLQRLYFCVFLGWGAYSGNIQGLLLPLHSRITLGRTQGPYGMLDHMDGLAVCKANILSLNYCSGSCSFYFDVEMTYSGSGDRIQTPRARTQTNQNTWSLNQQDTQPGDTFSVWSSQKPV